MSELRHEGESGVMTGIWYSVYAEALAPPGWTAPADEDAADALTDLLEEHSGVVSAGAASWGATVSVPASDVREAAEHGASLIERMAHKAGMPSWPLVRAEAVREDVLEADNARPTLPELVSVPEAAEILGVSQQRVRELSRARGFPSRRTCCGRGASGCAPRWRPTLRGARASLAGLPRRPQPGEWASGAAPCRNCCRLWRVLPCMTVRYGLCLRSVIVAAGRSCGARDTCGG